MGCNVSCYPCYSVYMRISYIYCLPEVGGGGGGGEGKGLNGTNVRGITKGVAERGALPLKLHF